MSTKIKRKLFESEQSFRRRQAHEDNERTIERLGGSRPKQGFFESDASYRRRVWQESRESIAREASGSKPKKRLMESQQDYQERIAQQANEHIVEKAAGKKPTRGIFESGEKYRKRVELEAREKEVEHATGKKPRRRFLESELRYRSRVQREAAELGTSSLFPKDAQEDSEEEDRCMWCGSYLGSSEDCSYCSVHDATAEKTEKPPSEPRAQKMYRMAVRYGREGKWPESMNHLRASLAQDPWHSAAIAGFKRIYCPRCRISVRQPSTSAIVDYARFWRGACPRCETQLRWRVPVQAQS